MRYTPFKLVLLALVSFHTATANASSCLRWQNDLDACNVLPLSKCSNQSIWTPQDWITFQNWKYSDTAKEACDKYWQKWDPGVYNGISDVFPAEADPTNPQKKDCYMDGTGDGHATPDDTSFRTLVTEESVTRDTCCDLTPQGPYASLPGLWPVARGGDFAQTLKDAILVNNNTTWNIPISYEYHSDATTVPPMASAADYWTVLVKRGGLLDRYPEIDHIIPRRDSKGCGCGSNSKSNAIVISRKLNAKMSNNCLDPDRLEILDAYTH